MCIVSLIHGQAFLQKTPGTSTQFSKINIPLVHYHTMRPQLSSTMLLVSPDPWSGRFPEISNRTTFELCGGLNFSNVFLTFSGVLRRMKSFNISSCADYFCSGNVPVFYSGQQHENEHYHFQMITYCLYCDRPDYQHFQTLLNTQPQCKQFMNRTTTCPEGKCSDVCIDSHIFEFDNTNLRFSMCYAESLNQFVYQTDFLHLSMLPFEAHTCWIIRMSIQLVFEAAMIFAIIIPNFVIIIPKIWREPVKGNIMKLFDMRMMSIYILFVAQFPLIILGLWAAVCTLQISNFCFRVLHC